jgi:hypothetical protein
MHKLYQYTQAILNCNSAVNTQVNMQFEILMYILGATVTNALD